MNFDIQAAKSFITASNKNIIANKDYLSELDSIMGDGDLGLTMSKGFCEAEKYALESEEEDIGKFFMRVGMTFSRAVPSTMGTLVASAFMNAGKSVLLSREINSDNIGAFFKGLADGIEKRGRCKVGDRTIYDVLFPMSEAAESAGNDGLEMEAAAKSIYAAAEAGLDATKYMVPTTGKALYHADKAEGLPDQGGVVGMLIAKSFYECITSKGIQ